MAITYDYPQGATAPSFMTTLAHAMRVLRGWLLVRQTENELSQLSPRQLADIGLTGPHLPVSYRRALLAGGGVA